MVISKIHKEVIQLNSNKQSDLKNKQKKHLFFQDDIQMASRYRKRFARGLGSQRGEGRVQRHRRWSRHSQAPRSPGGLGEAGLGTPKAWSQTILPTGTGGKVRPMLEHLSPESSRATHMVS